MANKSRGWRSLSSRQQFESLYDSGKRIDSRGFLLVFIKDNVGFGIRIGMTVPRYVGNAVLRNKMKRWLRDELSQHIQVKTSSRQIELSAKGLDLNFVFKRRPEDFYKKLLRAEFQKCVDRSFRFLQNDL